MMGCAESEPFALRVLGDSMEPEFNEGHIITIEPNGVVENGSYVFAVYEEEYIFRQLLIENGRYFLKPLNKEYPTQEIAGLDAIKGVITQRAGTRRKEHKRYV
ncbi:S24 family peptidase [Candidatus Parabeggiatoa sp. HSG14]|uniref:S24 family peptidase n=1 Tax=Candidatus Parabeggiatoa sp. HSG14 TaxID=3055593 RepID=UPI0025A91006|nr:S24 family peptidase [Thiotrichales bacterium HSG14]